MKTNIYKQIEDGKVFNKDELLVAMKVEKTRSLLGGIVIGFVFAISGIIAMMGAGVI